MHLQILDPFPEHQEDVYQHLAARAAAMHAARRGRVLIGIAGAPGSGKSTTAASVCRLLNSNSFLGSERCIVVPMDGARRSLPCNPTAILNRNPLQRCA